MCQHTGQLCARGLVCVGERVSVLTHSAALHRWVGVRAWASGKNGAGVEYDGFDPHRNLVLMCSCARKPGRG